jgi:hypothetical protein
LNFLVAVRKDSRRHLLMTTSNSINVKPRFPFMFRPAWTDLRPLSTGERFSGQRQKEKRREPEISSVEFFMDARRNYFCLGTGSTGESAVPRLRKLACNCLMESRSGMASAFVLETICLDGGSLRSSDRVETSLDVLQTRRERLD